VKIPSRQYFVSLALGLLCAPHAWALIDLSIKGGGTITQHKIAFANGENGGGSSKGVGYILGVGADFGGQGFGIATDLFYTSRSSVPVTFGDNGYEYRLRAIEIPVLLRLRILYFQVGAGLAYAAKVGTVRIDGGWRLPVREYSYDELALEEFEVSAAAAITGRFPTESFGDVLLEARWNQGLTNRAKFPVGKTSFKSYSYDLLVGLTF
jgi:hypothetical protein